MLYTAPDAFQTRYLFLLKTYATSHRLLHRRAAFRLSSARCSAGRIPRSVSASHDARHVPSNALLRSARRSADIYSLALLRGALLCSVRYADPICPICRPASSDTYPMRRSTRCPPHLRALSLSTVFLLRSVRVRKRKFYSLPIRRIRPSAKFNREPCRKE